MEVFSYLLKDKIDKNFFMLDILEQVRENKQVVIACIGTDLCIADSYGPLVGTLLREADLKNIIVYGTLDNPIHALNVNKISQDIMTKHKNDIVIAIDACISKDKHLHDILYQKKPICPGKGNNKKLSEIGHVAIKCCMGKNPDTKSNQDSVSRLRHTYKEAKFTASIIKELDNLITNEKEIEDEVSFDLH